MKDYTDAAKALGFRAAVIDTAQIPLNADFRIFCEQNRCGQYNANYSCPPACGTAAEMKERILQYEHALILLSCHSIENYKDADGIMAGKGEHNRKSLELAAQFRADGVNCLMCGCSCCSLCEKCLMAQGLPCLQPEKRWSCLSAYCMDVAKLAELAELPFAWDEKKLFCFGMILY